MIWLIVQEVDPCEDLTDDDIRTAIQNATGPKSALFVPEVGLLVFLFCLDFSSIWKLFLFASPSSQSRDLVPFGTFLNVCHWHLYAQVPFEVLIRRQIARLLDPSLQCARFIYDELIKVGKKWICSSLYSHMVIFILISSNFSLLRLVITA